MADLLFRVDHVIRSEIDVIRHQMIRNNIELIEAEASFVDPHHILLNYGDERRGGREMAAKNIIIATGTEATKDPHIPFDGKLILTSDDIFKLDRVPRTLTVVGGGVIGAEYAGILTTLGIRVTLVDKRTRLLDFVDAEIIDTLIYHLRQNRLTLRLGEEVSGIEPIKDEHGERVRIHLASGKQITTEKALYSIGRTAATQSLNLKAVGLIPIVDSNASVFRNQTGVSTAFLWFMNVKTPRVNQLSPSKPKTCSTFSQKGLSTSVISDSIEVNVSKTLFPI